MITSSLEDYLELIYNLIEQNKLVKAVDIAAKFSVSRSSVSEALIRLADMDLIIYEGRKGIKITQKGIEQAKITVRKHAILSEFFEKVLKVNHDVAEKNACKIEHVIDEEIIKNMHTLIKKHEQH